MRSRKLLYAYGIAAIAMVALVTSAVFVGLSGGNPTPLESSGAQVDGRVYLVESDFAPSLPESEAKAQAIDFLRGPWDIDEPTKLPIQVATGAFTGLREDTNTQTSNLGVWVVVFHDFPALARVPRGATSIPTDPRVTVIVDDNSGNVIYSALSWAHGIMTPIPTRTAVPTRTPLPSGITGATPIPTGSGQLHPPQLTTVAPQPASPGSQITVTGTGGYIKITGGYSEGSRQFHLYFDEQLIGTIGCMMNACRAKARIPEDATPGEHKLSAEGGSSITVTVE